MTKDTLDELLAIIDFHLSPTNDRTIYSSNEVQDILLDLRNLIQSETLTTTS